MQGKRIVFFCLLYKCETFGGTSPKKQSEKYASIRALYRKKQFSVIRLLYLDSKPNAIKVYSSNLPKIVPIFVESAQRVKQQKSQIILRLEFKLMIESDLVLW